MLIEAIGVFVGERLFSSLLPMERLPYCNWLFDKSRGKNAHAYIYIYISL